MKKLKNEILLHNDYVEIIASNRDYKHSVLIDTDDLSLVGKVRISNYGYAYTCIKGLSVSNVVMMHESNMITVVDHRNGNKLDNRKQNLRIVTQHQNSQNKSQFIRNNTGKVGVSYRSNGKYEYYRVSLTDRSGGIVSNRQGRRVVKQFNICKLGKSEAFRLANEYLLIKKIELGYLI